MKTIARITSIYTATAVEGGAPVAQTVIDPSVGSTGASGHIWVALTLGPDGSTQLDGMSVKEGSELNIEITTS